MDDSKLIEISKSKDITDKLPSMNRWELLPCLFRVKNKPFTLEGREQFSVLFEKEIVRETIILSGRQLGKSMSLSRSEIFNLLSIPNFQLLYVAPLQEQTRRYSDLYISEAIQSCPLAQRLQCSDLAGVLSDAKIIKATGHQTFANGSGIQLTYAKTSADRARGIFCDAIDVDETQDISGDSLPIIQESLTASDRFGFTRYTGTAKVTENLIEHKWQQSSQCEWVMKCQGCGYYNIPNLDGKVLQMIQADGMHCLHCGKRLDVSVGQWIAAYPDRMSTFRGYHIPQVVCPFIVENRNNWDKLLHKLMNGVLATFIQENLGISYSVGQRLLTMAHIRRQCVLPSTKTLQEELKRNPARYSFVVAGIDWGGAELTSFTVITVIGIRPNGRIDVIWAKRYRGYDPDEQMTDIAKICRFYNVAVCLSGDSLVLTKSQGGRKRYKRIVDVKADDRVWDGHEWVPHDGVRLMKYVRRDELYRIGNTRLTGDHKVYVSERRSVKTENLNGRWIRSAMKFRHESSPVSPLRDVFMLSSALVGALGRAVLSVLCGKSPMSAKAKAPRSFGDCVRRISEAFRFSRWIDRAGEPEKVPMAYRVRRWLVRFIEWANGVSRTREGDLVPVFDIVNAGPRHRFACSDVVVSNCAADAGMGLDKNQILSKRFGIPIVQMQYTRQLKLFGKNRSTGRTNVVQCWTIDKVMALDTLFLAIRNRRIFFPKDEQFQATMLSDLLSPYETTTEVGGMTHRLYLRNEAQPDDFCHALCFASMAAMKLLGMAVDDMIPAEAFGGGRTDDEPPTNDWLDPNET